MKTIIFLFLAVLSGIIISCSKTPDTSSLYVPSYADTTATATLAELQEGRALYVNNCATCHQLYSPDNFTPTQWQGIMASMAPRTGMNSDEVTLVTKYVTRGQ